MNENERNEHFQGFARLLWSELQTALHDLIREPEDIIAERAYDLVEYILNQTPTGTRYIHYFKDMDEWPEHRRFADALADLAKIKPPD